MQITWRERWSRARGDTKLSDLVKHEIGVAVIAAVGSVVAFDDLALEGELTAIAVTVVAACVIWPIILLTWNFLRAPSKIMAERLDAADQRIRDLEVALEPDTDGVITPKRDWTVRDALCWWKGSDQFDGDSAWQLSFFDQLRQAARDGDLAIWGRKNVGDFPLDMYESRPSEVIPAGYWQDHQIDPIPHLISQDPDKRRRSHTYTPGGRERDRFYDLMVSSTEIKSYGAWPVPEP